ncbi:MAG: hypothetical protein R3E53_02715 [Myxococcota bacterium]
MSELRRWRRKHVAVRAVVVARIDAAVDRVVDEQGVAGAGDVDGRGLGEGVAADDAGLAREEEEAEAVLGEHVVREDGVVGLDREVPVASEDVVEDRAARAIDPHAHPAVVLDPCARDERRTHGDDPIGRGHRTRLSRMATSCSAWMP